MVKRSYDVTPKPTVVKRTLSVTEVAKCSTQDWTTPSNNSFRLYRERWLIVAVVCMIQITNAALWISFSPVANMAASYYNTSEANINWMSTIYFVIDTVFSLPAVWFNRKYGLKYVIYMSCFLNALGSGVRLLGTFDFIPQHYRFSVTITGQTIAALAFPFLMCLPTSVSQLWFPEKERIYSTSLCSISSSVGGALACLIVPQMVTKPSHLYIMNVSLCTAGIIAGILGVFVRHSTPPTPPSVTASIDRTSDITSFYTDLKQAVTNKDLMILLVCGGGITLGIPSSLTTVLQQSICPWGYSNVFAGYLGFIFVAAGTVSSSLVALSAEKFSFYEEIMKVGSGIGTIFLITLILLVRIPHLEYPIAIVMALYGATALACWPIIEELGVETAYPINEGMVGNFVVLSGNIQGAIFIPLMMVFVQPMNNVEIQLQTCSVGHHSKLHDLTYSMVFLMAVNTLEIVVLILFCRPKYRRKNAEKIQNERNSVSVTPDVYSIEN